MQLGNFSVSLTVKNIARSREFYEKLGFQAISGEAEAGWLIMANSGCVIGLFQGMFDRNMLTFNPGWDSDGNTLTEFQDVRDIQKVLRSAGVEFVAEADEETSGSASCIVVDPDGNPILIDQHV